MGSEERGERVLAWSLLFVGAVTRCGGPRVTITLAAGRTGEERQISLGKGI